MGYRAIGDVRSGDRLFTNGESLAELPEELCKELAARGCAQLVEDESKAAPVRAADKEGEA